MDITIPSELNEFLIWLGSPIVVGFVLSWLLERLDMWQGLNANAKQLILIGVSIGLPAVSKLLQDNLSTELIEQLQPWWEIIVVGLGIYFASQAAHILRKSRQDSE
jgi:hypothetical protein